MRADAGSHGTNRGKHGNRHAFSLKSNSEFFGRASHEYFPWFKKTREHCFNIPFSYSYYSLSFDLDLSTVAALSSAIEIERSERVAQMAAAPAVQGSGMARAAISQACGGHMRLQISSTRNNSAICQ